MPDSFIKVTPEWVANATKEELKKQLDIEYESEKVYTASDKRYNNNDTPEHERIIAMLEEELRNRP